MGNELFATNNTSVPLQSSETVEITEAEASIICDMLDHYEPPYKAQEDAAMMLVLRLKKEFGIG